MNHQLIGNPIFRLSGRLTGYAGLAFLLFGLMVISSVQFSLAAKLVVILLLQIFTGKEIYAFFTLKESTSFIESVAMGFSIGSLAWLLGDQLFVGLSLPHVGWLLPLLLAALTRIIRQSSYARVKKISHPEIETVSWIVVSSLLGLSGEWVWPLPFALIATALLLARKTEMKMFAGPTFLKATFFTLTVTGLITIFTRPKIWWITQTDTHFNEAISKSVATWGFRDSILAAGYTLKYHWFPYAWTGMVSRISDAPNWVVLTRVGPLVAALCIVSLVWTISLRLIPNKSAAIFAVLIFVASPVFGDWSLSVDLAMFGSYSQLFATIWLVPILLWMIDVERSAIRHSWVLISIYLVGLVGGKVSHAAIALIAFLGFQFARCLKNTDLLRVAVFQSCLAITSVLATTYLLFGRGESLRWRPGDWVPYLQGDLYPYHGLSLLIAGSVFIVGFTFALVQILYLVKRRNLISFSILFGVSLALICGVMITNMSNRLNNLNPNGLFFLHTSLILVLALTGIVFSPLSSNLSKRQIIFAVVCGIAAIQTNYIIPNTNSGSGFAVALRLSRSLVFLVPCGLFAIARISKKINIKSRPNQTALLLAVSFLVILSGSNIIKGTLGLKRDYATFAGDGESFLPSKDLVELSNWFETNSPPDVIYASNNLCATPVCSSPEFLNHSLMVSSIGRKSVMQAPLFVSGYSKSNKALDGIDFGQRIESSINFAVSPSIHDFELLRMWGAKYYVIDLTVSDENYWNLSSAIIFENQTYRVLDLDEVSLN